LKRLVAVKVTVRIYGKRAKETSFTEKCRPSEDLKLHPVKDRFFPYDQNLWLAYQKAVNLRLPETFSGQSFPPNYRLDQTKEAYKLFATQATGKSLFPL
jgi:hypothetical protein